MRFVCTRGFALLFLVCVCLLPAYGNESRIGQWWKQLFDRNKDKEVTVNIQELTLDENIAVPEIKSPYASRKVRELVTDEIKRLQKVKGITVTAERDGEVIKGVVLMEALFLPNDTLLWERAQYALRPFVRYIAQPDMFHMLIVTHSDGTGSPEYNLNLTDRRAYEIRQWLIDNGACAEMIAIYGCGAEDPVAGNNSIENRRRNRRTEFYIVPGNALIKQAERGKISF